MLFGRLKYSDEDESGSGVEVMIMLGRFHLYEGYTIDQVRLWKWFLVSPETSNIFLLFFRSAPCRSA